MLGGGRFSHIRSVSSFGRVFREAMSLISDGFLNGRCGKELRTCLVLQIRVYPQWLVVHFLMTSSN
jgi:hypothetical protein